MERQQSNTNSNNNSIVFVNETQEVAEDCESEVTSAGKGTTKKTKVRTGKVRLRKPIDTNEFREHFFLMKLNKKGGDSVVIHAKKRSEQDNSSSTLESQNCKKKKIRNRRSSIVSTSSSTSNIVEQNSLSCEATTDESAFSEMIDNTITQENKVLAEREKRKTTINQIQSDIDNNNISQQSMSATLLACNGGNVCGQEFANTDSNIFVSQPFTNSNNFTSHSCQQQIANSTSCNNFNLENFWKQKIEEIKRIVQNYCHSPERLPLKPVDPQEIINEWRKLCNSQQQ
ncbi:hypothetical protein ABK040_015621 [Willaertia magna]